ncbi:MAG TPA: HAD family phosphatase [bacterium]|jgi:beta-phosphoglucomutase
MRISPDQYQAVIFDLDGVLIDSMPHHVRAWQEVFRSFGVELPDEELRMHEGEKAKITIGRLARKHGLNFNDDELEQLVEQKRQIYRRSAPRGLRSLATRILKQLQDHGFKLAIVTGSVRPNLEWTLSEQDLSNFQAIVTSEECQNGKPSADPYLLAAKRLDLRPSQCLVIENAPLGVRSAKAAGMKCIGITTTLPADTLGEADWIMPDLDSLQIG